MRWTGQAGGSSTCLFQDAPLGRCRRHGLLQSFPGRTLGQVLLMPLSLSPTRHRQHAEDHQNSGQQQAADSAPWCDGNYTLTAATAASRLIPVCVRGSCPRCCAASGKACTRTAHHTRQASAFMCLYCAAAPPALRHNREQETIQCKLLGVVPGPGDCA